MKMVQYRVLHDPVRITQARHTNDVRPNQMCRDVCLVTLVRV